MPSHKQVTTNPAATARALGKSSTETLNQAFGGSPVGRDNALKDDGSYDSPIREHFAKLTLDGIVNDGGHTFGEFDRDFSDAPAMDEVEHGGPGGQPASPYVPNVASPGPGSTNASDIPAAPEGFGSSPTSDSYGTGVGSQLSPDDSSAAQATHTLGDYGLGKSPYGR